MTGGLSSSRKCIPVRRRGAGGVRVEASATSIDDLDGTFSFLVSTRDEIGYAKDRLAVEAETQ